MIDAETFYSKAAEAYTSEIRVSPEVPPEMTSSFFRDLYDFNNYFGRKMAERAGDLSRIFKENAKYVDRVIDTGGDELKRLSNILARYDRNFRSAIALLNQEDCTHYVFLCEKAQNTCDTCLSAHGKLLTAAELSQGEFIPPLHINCQCRLVALDAAGQIMYYWSREHMISTLDRVLDEMGYKGGIFRLNGAGAATGITPDKLSVIRLPELPAITDGINDTLNWEAHIAQFYINAAGGLFGVIGDTAKWLFGGAFEHYAKLAERAVGDSNFLGVLWNELNALTWGLPESAVKTAYDEWDRLIRLVKEPGVERFLFNLGNLLTFGLGDRLNNVFNPDEPLSEAHWKEIWSVIFEIVMTLYSAYSAGEARQCLHKIILPCAAITQYKPELRRP